MASKSDLSKTEAENFQSLFASLQTITFQDTEDCRKSISQLLDEFNGLEYSLRNIVTQEEAGEVLARFCFLVPMQQEMLVTKLCQLIVNLISRQKLVLDHNNEMVTEYIVGGLQRCQPWAFNDLLQALSALIYENSGKISKFHELLVGRSGLLLQMVDSVDEDMQRNALHCIENICARTTHGSYLTEEQQMTCWKIFLRLLHAPKPMRMDDINHCRILFSSLRGLQNLLSGAKAVSAEQLGPLLAAVKVYMLHGMPNHKSLVPATLHPTPAIHYDPQPAPPPTPHKSDKPSEAVSLRPGAGKTPRKPAKKSKKRRSKNTKREQGENDEDESTLAGQMEHTSITDTDGSSQNTDSPSSRLVPSLLPTWAKISSSESDFSDAEGGTASKLRAYHYKVRLCALTCFHTLIKVTERRVVFGYWTSFLPDNSSYGGPQQGAHLFTVIMRDPSPRVRASAIAVMTAMFEGSRPFLAAAEDLDPSRQAFTPFSVTLGSMVKETHRCLLLSLVSETSPLAITQIIKCLGTLIPNVPYQRLKPGLLSRVVKQIKPFLASRDPNIKVACLTCLGSVVSVQAPLVEVWQLLQAVPIEQRMSVSEAAAEEAGPVNSSEDSLCSPSPGIATPTLSSGSITPTLSEVSNGGDMSWVVKLAVKNIAAHLVDTLQPARDRIPTKRSTPGNPQPLPVRLESLQLLAKLSKGYFTAVKDCLPLLCDVIQFCLEDTDPSVQLHGAKLLEEIGAMLLSNISSADGPDTADVNQALEVWQQVFNGQIWTVLQWPTNHAVRSTCCDCLSNIGPLVIDKLAMPKRIMCMTLLLGLTSDEDHQVRAAAVRALGVYILYPCLREDVSFVTDAANSIVTTLEENNIGVKIKAAWSLANLSNALVLNKCNSDEVFMEEFPDTLLLRLFEAAIKASQDNDKVKSNAVRALGNFLQYLPHRCCENMRFEGAVKQAIQALVKNVGNGTMKVRWNACYAASNLFKNNLLPLGTAPWTGDIHKALATVIRECKNFKVRINAAMALSVPDQRCHYGSTQMFVAIWDSLISGLQSSETVTDFTEYKYRDSLLEQACTTLLHLVTMVTADDLRILNKTLSSRRAIIHDYLARYKTLKVSASGEAKTANSAQKRAKQVELYLESLQAAASLEEDQQIVVALLKHLFVSSILGVSDEEDRPASPLTSFRQTYD